MKESKKKRNRKIVAQNKRNRIINRRYTSTIKSLSKLFKSKIKQYFEITEETQKNQTKNELKALISPLNKILDKAVKKNVIHKNLAARKKSLFTKLANKI